MKTAEQLLSSYVECESLDDLLEIMDDNGLLSKTGKDIKRYIWEQTEHKKGHILDPLERSWLSLTSHHKNFLIAEAMKGRLNPRASKFVLSKTDEMEKCYKLSLGQKPLSLEKETTQVILN